MSLPKILLVDDDADRHAVAERLRDAGYVVVAREVAIGTAAAIVRERPGMVLWDVTMPLVSEIDVAALRSNPQVPAVTLVVYARRTPAELTELVHRCGADGFVEKDDDPDAIVRRVRAWQTRRPRRKKGRSGTERRARYVVVAGQLETHRALLREVRALGTETVLRHTDAGFEALRWMGSADPPDLIVVGTSLTDLPAHVLARRGLQLDDRWRDRLVIVDEGVPVGFEAADLPQRIWPRGEPLEGLLAALDDQRETG